LKVYKKNPFCPFCRRAFELPLPEINQEMQILLTSYLKRLDSKDKPVVNQKVIEQNAFILQLPDEVLLDILSFLPPKSVGKTVQVCKGFQRVCEDPLLWREFCQNAFPFCSVDKYGKNWKYCFIGRSNIQKGWEGGKAGDFNVVTLRGHKNYVNCFRLYRNNIISGSADFTLKVWKVDSTDPIHTLVGHNGIINCLEFNELRIVSGSFDSSIKIWDTKTGIPIHSVNHHGSVNCLQFDENKIISGGSDSIIRVWDVRQANSLMSLNGHFQPIIKLEFDNNKIVTCAGDSIKIWDIRTGNCQRDLSVHQAFPRCFRILGDKVIGGYHNGKVIIWDVNNGTQSVLSGHNGTINDLQCDGKTIISAGKDGTLKVWDIGSKNLLKTLDGQNGEVNTIQFSGNRVVSGGSDNCIKVWDLKKGNRLYTLLGGSLQQRSNNPPHPGKQGCTYLEFDDSRIVASFSSLVRVYDFETFKPLSK